jgi:DNA-binding CsgD family transcriptional regulator
MRELSMTARAIRMRERRRQIKEGCAEVEERTEQHRTLQEVADILGVTNQYVSTVERRALAKLRRKLEKVWEDYQNDRQQSTRNGSGGRIPRVVPARDMGVHAPDYSGDISEDDDGSD